MKTISDMDYYNEKELEFNSKSGKDFIYDKNNQFGYTKIDTEEQVNKYAALDQKTDFYKVPRRSRTIQIMMKMMKLILAKL